MNIPIIFAHGGHLIAGLTFWLLAIESSAICLLIGGVLHLFEKIAKRQLRIVAIVWFIAILLSLVTASVMDQS